MHMVVLDNVTQCFRQCVVSSFLSLSRGPTCNNKRRHSNWNQKDGNQWHAGSQFWGEGLHCSRDVGTWMVETLPDWYLDKRSFPRIFPYKHSSCQDRISDKTESGALFGYVHCVNIFQNIWGQKLANFPPISKIRNVCRQVIGSLRQEFSEKEELMCQPIRSLFFLALNYSIVQSLQFCYCYIWS